ncbi:MAG: ferritin-like domain-containing protein [Burkholderiales bacterium]|nr:ferritin-like domain-containing protein [Anaerolineae bacterium]
MNSIRTSISRRDLLKGGVAVAGASALSFSQLFGFTNVFAQSGGDDPQTILNLAATAETLACTHYYSALTSGDLGLGEAQIDYLKAGLDAELQHLEFLNANGGETLVSEFYVPEGVFSDVEIFAQTTAVAETAFVAAYLAATRRFAELGNPLLAATAAQVAAVEAQHLALARQIGGRLPNHISLAAPLFINVSDAVPMLQPFLEGGEGYEGPAAYPGADAIRDAVGDGGVQTVLPFTQRASTIGTISSSAAAVNVRSGPGGDFSLAGSATSGDTVQIMGRNADGSWLMVNVNGATGWIAADLISMGGNISALPVTQ